MPLRGPGGVAPPSRRLLTAPWRSSSQDVLAQAGDSIGHDTSGLSSAAEVNTGFGCDAGGVLRVTMRSWRAAAAGVLGAENCGGRVVANDKFFQRPQAAAVLKHGVLRRYSTVFATMAGSATTGRVAYFDAYAGPGRYGDGSPGSPLLIVRTAIRTARWGRQVRCLFVEKNARHAADLKAALAEEAPTELTYQVLRGDVAEHVDTALAFAAGDAMLTFLDPWGTPLPYGLLTTKLLARPRSAPTEVLLNLNLESIARIGGVISTAAPSAHDEATLGRLDTSFGGKWWREEFRRHHQPGLDGSAAAAAQHVAGVFMRRVLTDTGFGSFAVPVRRRAGHQPLFLLMLFTRNRIAPWKFNEVVSSANHDWRRACAEADLDEMVARAGYDERDLFGDTTE